MNLDTSKAIASVSYNGVDVELDILNIAYGTTPPADTSKLWVPLAKKPDYVEFNGEFMGFGQNVLETWQDGDPTISPYSSIQATFSVCIGDYIYIFDNTSQYILKYDPANGTFTQCCSYSTIGSVSNYRACARGTDVFVVGASNTTALYKFDSVTNTLERIMTVPDTGFSSFVEFGGYLYQFLASSGNYISSRAYQINVDDKTYITLANYVPNCNNSARPYVWVYEGKIWILSYNNSTVYLMSYDTATDTYTTVKSGTWASFGVDYTLSADRSKSAESPIPVVGNKVYLLPDRKVSSNTTYWNGNPFIFDMETLMFTEGSTILEADDGYGRVNCGFALYDMGLYMIGGSNRAGSTTSSSSVTPNTKVNVYRIETYLAENHLKVFTDMFGKQTALVNGKNCKLYATVRNAYLGNEGGYARQTDVYIYDEDVAAWQTVDGISVTQDMLNALAELGVT